MDMNENPSRPLNAAENIPASCGHTSARWDSVRWRSICDQCGAEITTADSVAVRPPIHIDDRDREDWYRQQIITLSAQLAKTAARAERAERLVADGADRTALAEAWHQRDRAANEARNLRRDLCEIAEGCKVGVPDQAEAKKRIITIATERDEMADTLRLVIKNGDRLTFHVWYEGGGRRLIESVLTGKKV